VTPLHLHSVYTPATSQDPLPVSSCEIVAHMSTVAPAPAGSAALPTKTAASCVLCRLASGEAWNPSASHRPRRHSCAPLLASLIAMMNQACLDRDARHAVEWGAARLPALVSGVLRGARHSAAHASRGCHVQ